MNILFISSEAAPFAKTGGLGDVCGALPAHFAHSENVTLAIPEYDTAAIRSLDLRPADSFSVRIGERDYPALMKRANLDRGFELLLVSQELFFARRFLYGSAAGDYADNFERFLFFQKALDEYVRRCDGRWDIVHANDWQSALLPLLLARNGGRSGFRRPRLFFSIHNLGYQGIFPGRRFPELELEESYFSPENLEFFGQINFLKGGITAADRLLTVSPTYAQEIRRREFGFGLEGFLNRHAAKLTGILNGIDYTEWNPRTDRHLFQNYSPQALPQKAENKPPLYSALGLAADPEWPLAVCISRLAAQKGMDLLVQSLPDLLREKLAVIVLGTGDAAYAEQLRAIQEAHPRQMAFIDRFDEPLAHRLEAAGDILLMPSAYEPCGLNQLYSLKYGTVPVVRATGGLADTVEPVAAKRKSGTGFTFAAYEAAELTRTVRQALNIFRKNRHLWTDIQLNGMAKDFSWERSANSYLELYKKSLDEVQPHE